MLVNYVAGEGLELTVHKEVALGGCCRGNKGSGTETSPCAIYL